MPVGFRPTSFFLFHAIILVAKGGIWQFLDRLSNSVIATVYVLVVVFIELRLGPGAFESLAKAPAHHRNS